MEKLNLFLLITKDVIFYGYVIIAFLILGFQTSISQTAYPLKKLKRYWIFCTVTISYATLGFLSYPCATTFAMMCGLFFAAAAPYFRDNITQTITHYFGANLAMVLGIWLIYYDLGSHHIAMFTVFILLLLEYIPGFARKLVIHNKTTWIELIIYTAISVSLYLKFNGIII